MSARSPDVRRDAPALRFLLLCVGGWIVLRIMMLWNPATSFALDNAEAPWSPPSPFAANDATLGSPLVARPDGQQASTYRRVSVSPVVAAVPARRTPMPALAEGGPVGGSTGADRHALRLSLIARLLPSLPVDSTRSAAPVRSALWFPLARAEHSDPGQGKPFWIQRQLGGWALAGWVYLREGSGSAPGPLGAASQLGGSQAGLRLGYGFGDGGRVRAYGRATMAIQRPQQREIAFGLALAPLAHVPVDVAIEQRIAAGKEGRTALAMMASGGVSEIALPAGFRLDAYAQAGIVGARRRDGFADGAIVVDRRLGPDDTSPLRLGALAAGAVQPGAARVDVGPRLTLRLPEVGEGSRIALDWRQRVAGDARPESGLALTLASDF
ncbi:hypothetical protein SAMN05428974_2342 [Sphingopyxis sp. YR583]|jgi:hypothetical protein|uniref:hypothetical protein n=1 Tax=Sphingopyxis sp. YR583 TaxID=1881047 RepID=UPI0008A7CAE0|nr:hypothetical protein [Sphingopyxis sp. YR583]SEH17764.1 hypothetical protein SAMN05428974_2342 [Sphingopyxis sp. YR583]